jgi:hypothetical protein
LPGKSKFPIKYYVNSNAKQQENAPDAGDHRFECCEDQGPPGVLLQCTFPGSSKFPIKYYANSNTKQQENAPELEIIDLNFATIKGLLECCYLRLETSILRIDLRLGLCFLVIVFSLLETKVFMMNGE